MTPQKSCLRQGTKTALARVLCFAPQAQYGRCILILSHMRAATTVLTNVLAGHPQISGLGETQVPHNDPTGPGRILLSLAAQGAFRPTAPLLLDKILHSVHHAKPPQAFFAARAVFMIRSPGPSIMSILNLAQHTGMTWCGTPELAAEYYLDRIRTLSQVWHSFARVNRVGILTEELWEDPERVLAVLSDRLGLEIQLQNAFQSHPSQRMPGRGDPFADERHISIQNRNMSTPVQTGLPDGQFAVCTDAYEELRGQFKADQHFDVQQAQVLR